MSLNLAQNSFSKNAQAPHKTALRYFKNDVRYTYESFDGAQFMNCSHTHQNEENPYDWTVKCADAKGVEKRFTVHLAVSRFHHSTKPEVTYEVLYWVNGNGASSLYDFNQDGMLVSIESGQSLIGEDAELRLHLKLATQKN
jgi:hypothetical protein